MATKEEEAKIVAERQRQARAARDAAEARRQRFSQEELDATQRRINQREMPAGEIAHDVERSGNRGGAEGIAGLPGTPADLYRLGQVAKAYVQGSPLNGWNPLARVEYMGKTPEEVLALQDAEREAGTRGYGPKPSTLAPYTSEGFIERARPTNPDLGYEPKTELGEMTRRGASVVSGGAAGGAVGGLAGTPLRQVSRNVTSAAGRGGAGGLAAGGAMEAARSADLPPSVQMAAGLIAGPLAASYGGTTAADAIRRGVGARGITQAQVDRAETLVRRAREEGLTITRANALDWVTGGNAQGLSELQRIVESSGSPRLREAFQENAPPGPTRVRAYGERVLTDRFGQESQQPSTIGPRVANRMDQTVEAAKQDVNAQVRPQYQQFQTAPVDPQIMGALQADPHWGATAERVLNDTKYASYLNSTAPPGSVGFVELVNRVIREEREGLLDVTKPGTSRTAAEGIRPSLESGEATANLASRQLPPGTPVPPGQSPLELARQERARLQQQVVDPVEMGPEGQAAAGKTTENVQAAMFPPKPLEGSHVEIGRAVGNLAQRDPRLAEEFVRNYLGTEFSAQTGRNIGGEPYTAGTKFWKAVAGTDQQRQNLEAAITALPNGAQTWEVVREMGELFEAMGKKQPVGSKTAYNTEALEQLKGLGWGAAALKLAGTNFKALGQEVSDRVDQFRLGRNMDEVARLIQDPAAREEFARIATSTTPRSAARAAAVAKLINTALGAQAVQPVVESPLHEPLPGGP